LELIQKTAKSHFSQANSIILIYKQLVTFEDDDCICKATAENLKELTQLIETGYEYVCAMENVKLFRKRK